MKVRHLFFIIGVLSLLALAAPSFAFAQTPERITKLQIAVWPEFDDPRALVQLDGTLAAVDGYPRQLEFLIPATATLTATAYQDETQQYLNTDPATVTNTDNGMKRVAFKTPKPNFHVEYYDDAIKGSPDKTFEFAYTAVEPADAVELQVQQPLKSENFKIAPSAASVSDGQHGFKYHLFSYPAFAANQSLKLQISYTKTDPNPSMQNIQVTDSSGQGATQNAPTAEAAPTDPQQMYILIAAGILLAGGLLALGMWYMRRQPRVVFAGAGGGSTSRKSERATGFCSQCGNALHAGDNFCPKCGAKRK